MPLLLDERDVRSVLTMPDLIGSMRAALADYSAGRAQQPLRTVLELGDTRSFFGIMPASLAEPRAVGTKLVTVSPSNHEKGLPSHLATIVLLDPDTGALSALLDGRYITEARTAAVSAVSADLLALPDAATLAILGSGVQARSHLEALSCVRRLMDVRVWSPTESHRAAFARDTARDGLRISAAASAREAVDGADLIVVATASTAPVLESSWVADGAHICAIGACRPTHRELQAALVARSRVFVDSTVGALTEAGDIVMAIQEGAIGPEHIAGELGALVSGTVAGRQVPRQVTLFKSLGMAVEDVAAARLAYTRASAAGVGTPLAL
jgi:ornithine cyclodeaminase/alanine dehydrogenase-like protein (mu-crystallin family)